MPYSLKAQQLRRCKETKANGFPCRNWSLWGENVCVSHAPNPKEGDPPRKKPRCSCAAYEWPHRPGGGFCRWPDAPTEKCLTPAGTHDEPRWGRTVEGRLYGRRYVEMMRSAVGYHGNIRRKRGRPSKKRREGLAFGAKLKGGA